MFTQSLTISMLLPSLWYILIGFGLGFLFEKIILVQLRSRATEAKSESGLLVANAFSGLVLWIIGLIGIYYATARLPFEPIYIMGIQKGLVLAGIAIVTWIVRRVTIRLVSLYTHRPDTPFPSSSIFTVLTQIAVLGIGLLIALQSVGIAITPLITAMGVGGLALALGLQDTIANLFAGLTILASKKIVPGDIIEVADAKKGTVKDISWRYTTLRAANGNTIVLPNAKLAAELITNFSQPMTDISFSVELTIGYENDLEEIEKLLQKIAYDVLQKEEGGSREYIPIVRFQSFDDIGIHLKIFLKAENYSAQFALKHICIKRIHKAFQENGIVIPQHITTASSLSTSE